jgi:hypothetical protein
MLVSAFGSRKLRQTVQAKPLRPGEGSSPLEVSSARAWRGGPWAVSLSHEPQSETLIVAKPSRTSALEVKKVIQDGQPHPRRPVWGPQMEPLLISP